MRTFDYASQAPRLLTAKIVKLIATIHEIKGRLSQDIEAEADVLLKLIDIAKIQSTESSNRIEGINTTPARIKEIILHKTKPRDRNEEEISGYRDVLATIHENYEYIPPRASYILQLHRDLFTYSEDAHGGKYKTSDNEISETDAEGNSYTRFQPLSAFETPDAMERLCDTFIKEANRNELDPLLLIPMFVLDFLCIHPFRDGNGRMSRLLTLLLLYRSGFVIGKFISLEMLIEKNREGYYEALLQSSIGWQEDENDYLFFVDYYLRIILKAYRELEERVGLMLKEGLSKSERVRVIIERRIGKITKKEIVELCPDISPTTIEKALAGLVKQGLILKIGNGRYTKYIYHRV